MKSIIFAGLTLFTLSTLAIAPADALTGRIAKARLEHMNNKVLTVPASAQTNLTGRIAKARLEHLNNKGLAVSPSAQTNLTGRIAKTRLEQLNKR